METDNRAIERLLSHTGAEAMEREDNRTRQGWKDQLKDLLPKLEDPDLSEKAKSKIRQHIAGLNGKLGNNQE